MEQLQIIYAKGQPYGIRDKGGYILFFPKISKYPNQEKRYIDEIKRTSDIAEKILKALK